MPRAKNNYVKAFKSVQQMHVIRVSIKKEIILENKSKYIKYNNHKSYISPGSATDHPQNNMNK